MIEEVGGTFILTVQTCSDWALPFMPCHTHGKRVGDPHEIRTPLFATLYFNCICTLARTVSSLVEKDSIGEFLRNPGPSLTLFGAHALPDASQVATAVSLHRSKSVRSLLGSLSLSIHLFSSVMCYSWKSVRFHGSTNFSVSRLRISFWCWICISACEELALNQFLGF